MKKITLLLISILLSSNLLSQEYIIKDAREHTAEFLKALKISNSPEGKKMLSGLVFEPDNSFPVISSSEILFEKLFSTDVDEIKGYKGYLEIKPVGETSTASPIKYLLISYLDLKDSKWKVFTFREKVNIAKEILTCEDRLENSDDSEPIQNRIRDLAYWEILNGEISSAKENFKKAYSEAKSNKDADFKIPESSVLNSIMGKKK